jgi:hypothetical protein
MAFTGGFKKVAQEGRTLGAAIGFPGAGPSNVGKATPKPLPPPTNTSVMGQAFGSIRKAFGGR